VVFGNVVITIMVLAQALGRGIQVTGRNTAAQNMASFGITKLGIMAADMGMVMVAQPMVTAIITATITAVITVAGSMDMAITAVSKRFYEIKANKNRIYDKKMVFYSLFCII
jgi:hypothetical protein